MKTARMSFNSSVHDLRKRMIAADANMVRIVGMQRDISLSPGHKIKQPPQLLEVHKITKMIDNIWFVQFDKQSAENLGRIEMAVEKLETRIDALLVHAGLKTNGRNEFWKIDIDGKK